MKFKELTYAQDSDPYIKRVVIQMIERASGRNYFVPYYEIWRREYVETGKPIMAAALKLVGIDIVRSGASWPPPLDPDKPLVIIANHPFGIADGLTALALAEELGRPFKVLIHKDLLKAREIRDYALSVDFSDTREAVANNLRMRKEALELLKAGTTIIVFPAGGVSTAPTPWGRAVDLPWKLFTARMIMESQAQVQPLYFVGQNSPLFHAASWLSLTLRLSLIIREFRTQVNKPVDVRIGKLIPFESLAGMDRRTVMSTLFDRVHALSKESVDEIRARVERLPAYLKGGAPKKAPVAT